LDGKTSWGARGGQTGELEEQIYFGWAVGGDDQSQIKGQEPQERSVEEEKKKGKRGWRKGLV